MQYVYIQKKSGQDKTRKKGIRISTSTCKRRKRSKWVIWVTNNTNYKCWLCQRMNSLFFLASILQVLHVQMWSRLCLAQRQWLRGKQQDVACVSDEGLQQESESCFFPRLALRVKECLALLAHGNNVEGLITMDNWGNRISSGLPQANKGALSFKVTP